MLRRFVVVIVAFLVLAAAFLLPWKFILFVAYVLIFPPCLNEVYQDTLSPDGAYRAVLFQRDCGATTWFSTQVSILEAGDELPNEPGNVFIIDDHPDQTGVRLRWLETGELLIITPDRRTAHKAVAEMSGIVVRYERP